jgi:glucose-6-phosphate isomerase
MLRPDMNTHGDSSWDQFKAHYFDFPDLGLALDLSRAGLPPGFLEESRSRMKSVFTEMEALEQGAIANSDEKRRVGHYWLRAPELAPEPALREAIETTLSEVRDFARSVHAGSIGGHDGPFRRLLLIGIGGSALGPQFVAHALGHPRTDKLSFHCLDNTDPDGIERVLSALTPDLGRTLCVVVSKSGGTKETRNAMLEAKAAYTRGGLSFEQHAVAITQQGSALDQLAERDGWLHRFPMWDWVGGRTSQLSAVGLLPAALQGFDIKALLAGARICDQQTRTNNVTVNPSAMLALAWHYCCNGKGEKDMVILPYKDRLELFPKYLQQLIMESLGKELDREGRVVNQGITVYGNKGSTDQHAYVQQLREGVPNFFATFIEVSRSQSGPPLRVEDELTSGDFLFGFFLGTREAITEKGRPSVTLTIPEVSAFSVGVLIALYERAVGYYASLVNINAYHQPGVEAGKKAAGNVLDLQTRIHRELNETAKPLTVEELSSRLSNESAIEWIFKICEHLAANPEKRVKRVPAERGDEARYMRSSD